MGQAISIRLGQNGRIVIPAPVRDALRLKEGDTLLLTVEPQHGRLVLETEETVIARLHELVGAAEGGALVSEELLLERRKEAQREAREMARGL
jgi:AbrB family looped-hinge helix DNA binding protein